MTREQLIAEILSAKAFSQYDEEGLVDHTSLKRWIRITLRSFGGNLMVSHDKILRVKNGRAKLPEHFWKLELAKLCEPECYEVVKKGSKNIQQYTFYKERLEGEVEWDNMSESWKWDKHRVVREVIFSYDSEAHFYYKKPKRLHLKKGFNRSACTSECMREMQDRNTHSSPGQINIVGDHLNTNFESGYVYIQYKGLMEQDGDLWIPETQHNRLEEYLIYHCRRRILEDIIMSGDDPNKAQMLKYYSDRELQSYILAEGESKMESLGSDWARKQVRAIRREGLRYNIMMPNR